MATRYVYTLEWHIAGYMMRYTLCGREISPPVYSSTSTGGESVCERCKRTADEEAPLDPAGGVKR